MNILKKQIFLLHKIRLILSVLKTQHLISAFWLLTSSIDNYLP
jgi:hypothetical protein